jgi:excisionase family DNA binding protein
MKNTYTISDAAHRLGVSYQRVTQIIKAGYLKTFRVGPTGYFVRIHKSDLEKYMRLCGKSIDESSEKQN